MHIHIAFYIKLNIYQYIYFSIFFFDIYPQDASEDEDQVFEVLLDLIMEYGHGSGNEEEDQH